MMAEGASWLSPHTPQSTGSVRYLKNLPCHSLNTLQWLPTTSHMEPILHRCHTVSLLPLSVPVRPAFSWSPHPTLISATTHLPPNASFPLSLPKQILPLLQGLPHIQSSENLSLILSCTPVLSSAPSEVFSPADWELPAKLSRDWPLSKYQQI